MIHALLLALALPGLAFAGERIEVQPRQADYWSASVGAGVLPSLSVPWPAAPGVLALRIQRGRWSPDQRVGRFLEVGLAHAPSTSSSGFADLTHAVKEQYRTLPVRAGLKVDLLPGPDWAQLAVIGSGSVAPGVHRLSTDDRLLARRAVLGFGAEVGIEASLVKAKRHGVTLGAAYSVQPTFQAGRAAMQAGRVADLGGLEISMGWIVFPRSAS